MRTKIRLALALGAALPLLAEAQTLTLTNGVQKVGSLTGTTVTMSGQCELWVTNATTPLSGCTVQLNSADSWLFLPQVKPSASGGYLGQVRILGANAVANGNVRVVEYGALGSVLIPHPSAYQPLRVYANPHFTGASQSFGQFVYYKGLQLGALNGTISSFKLKRGYMATFAQNENGSGASLNYVAQDGDLDVSVLPENLDNKIHYLYVLPWRWTDKKGSCDVAPENLNASWWYNWNISANSSSDIQYVAIKQQPYWPGLNQDWQARGINHLLGFNEPNNPVEDAYKNLSPVGSVSDAVTRWPELLGTGLRVGAPAVTDGGYSWIVDFINQADAAGLRVDYVPVHYYRSYPNNDYPAGAAANLYNYLKSIYDVVKRPIWVTEFNNGANWTSDPDPTVDQNRNVIEAMINMMDSTPWIERYSVYSRVEWFRQTHYDDGSITPMGAMYHDHLAPVAYVQGLQDNGTRSASQLRFEGNVIDSSGNGNNGVTTGTPAYADGHAGKAILFDGTSTKVTLPPNIARSSAFSFAAWLNWKGGANWQRVFDFGNSTTQYLFLTANAGNGLRFAIKNGGAEQIVQGPALPQNQWCHVAVTIDGSTARLYVNGVQVAANTSLSISPANFSPRMNFLGASQFVVDPLFNGLMDEVIIADYALSGTQVASLQSDSPPAFTSSSISRSAASVGSLYSETLAGSAADADTADRVTYSKTGGPDWLSVSADGYLGGVPTDADEGINMFSIQATDASGMSGFTQLSVTVSNAPRTIAGYDFDSSTASSAGTFNAAPTGAPTYVAGHAGQAISLNGTNQYLTLPSGIANLNDFTIAAWVKWDGGGAWQRIFDFGNGTSDSMFLTPSSGSSMRFSMTVGGTTQDLNGPTLPSGSWQHVVVTHTGNISRLFVNGSQVASVSMTFKPSDFKPKLNYIGKSQFTADPMFKGAVDEFRIWNYGLSPAQVSALYSRTPPAFRSDPISLAPTPSGIFYSGALAGNATNSTGTAISFSKVFGPAWLSLNADGSLSGMPGKANIGPNGFLIRATDGTGLSDEAMAYINVLPGTDVIGGFGFEKNMRNAKGFGDATAIGSPSFAPGVNGYAVQLDGVDDYIALPASMLNVDEITVATWVFWDGTGGIWQRIFDFGTGTTQYMFLCPRSPGGKMRFAVRTPASASEQILEAPPVPPNQWTHVAVTLKGGAIGRIYMNGSQVSMGPVTVRPSTINPTLNYLGESMWSADAMFAGRFDDFQLYNRALTDFEIACLANPGRDSDRNGLTDSAETDVDSNSNGIPDYMDADDDGDGIPDAWELANGLSRLDPADAAMDDDGDGFSNVAEYIAGTRPDDPAEYFRVNVAPGQTAPPSITLNGIGGRVYTLLRSTSASGPWIPVLTNGPLSLNTSLILTDPSPNESGAFYRAQVSLP